MRFEGLCRSKHIFFEQCRKKGFLANYEKTNLLQSRHSATCRTPGGSVSNRRQMLWRIPISVLFSCPLWPMGVCPYLASFLLPSPSPFPGLPMCLQLYSQQRRTCLWIISNYLWNLHSRVFQPGGHNPSPHRAGVSNLQLVHYSLKEGSNPVRDPLVQLIWDV